KSSDRSVSLTWMPMCPTRPRRMPMRFSLSLKSGSKPSLSHRDNKQTLKPQHHLAVAADRISTSDLVGIFGQERLAHGRVKRREQRPQPRALEPFDHAGVVVHQVIILRLPDVDAAAQRTHEVIIPLRLQ